MPHPARILVVEDDVELRSSLAEVLSDEGYEVLCAMNGEEALQRLDERAAPSAIVLDLCMPVMDGWTFRSRQRSDPRFAGIPTVVISASAGSGSPEIQGLAADAFLAKPFDLTRLIEALQRLCPA
jgi:CheY-like chemotaxis protein